MKVFFDAFGILLLLHILLLSKLKSILGFSLLQTLLGSISLPILISYIMFPNSVEASGLSLFLFDNIA